MLMRYGNGVSLHCLSYSHMCLSGMFIPFCMLSQSQPCICLPGFQFVIIMVLSSSLLVSSLCLHMCECVSVCVGVCLCVLCVSGILCICECLSLSV